MNTDDSEVASYLPLSVPAFHLLVALAEGDRHGWAIRKQVELATGGRLRLSPGTLYGLIRRLEDQQLIAESDQRPPSEWDDERRRYYRLTDLGRRVAGAEAERMQRALDIARSMRIEVPEPGEA